MNFVLNRTNKMQKNKNKIYPQYNYVNNFYKLLNKGKINDILYKEQNEFYLEVALCGAKM